MTKNHQRIAPKEVESLNFGKLLARVNFAKLNEFYSW